MTKLKTLLATVLIFAIFFALTWVATCIMVKLIFMCFDLHFTFKIATGIWLSLALLKFQYSPKTNK